MTVLVRSSFEFDAPRVERLGRSVRFHSVKVSAPSDSSHCKRIAAVAVAAAAAVVVFGDVVADKCRTMCKLFH